jgi:AraC family transcriptional regulator, positive regulator of tynA and feaB
LSTSTSARAAPKTCLWDSHYGPSTAAFSTFRRFICGAFLPWSLERQCDDAFHGRAEGLILPAGAVAKTKSTPIIAARDRAELEDSPGECLYANYVMSGELRVQQGEHDFTAKRGDLVIYESRHPVITREKNTGPFENLTFRVDKGQVASFGHADAVLSCTLISAENMIAPLAACLGYLSENLLAIPMEEAAALFKVFGSLLPVAALAISKSHDTQEQKEVAQRSVMRELLEYVEAHLGAPDLSPRLAAAELGISLRYVHKLFAENGMTFCNYVTSKRLDYVRRDLSSDAFRHEPAYAIAARWGFDDPSAFNRIFKERFGMTPGRMRALCP